MVNLHCVIFDLPGCTILDVDLHVHVCGPTYNNMVEFPPCYSQTGCSFDGNSALLWCNVPILTGSLLYATCNFQFKFA